MSSLTIGDLRDGTHKLTSTIKIDISRSAQYRVRVIMHSGYEHLLDVNEDDTLDDLIEYAETLERTDYAEIDVYHANSIYGLAEALNDLEEALRVENDHDWARDQRSIQDVVDLTELELFDGQSATDCPEGVYSLSATEYLWGDGDERKRWYVSGRDT